jgi:succinate dehydrogenase / fumarate reductase flavoprotein subunit
MYQQFKELADVDITREAMEVGPTFHYMMGGVRVDADTAATSVPGLFAAGEVSGGMHGSNRLGGNSLSDLLVFGCRAGLAGAEYAAGLGGADRPAIAEADLQRAEAAALAPFRTEGGENPYAIQAELQSTMNDLVGIIRKAEEIEQALLTLQQLRGRVAKVGVEGHRQYNPGWHLALDLRNMLLVSECVAKAALERTESRGGHTRDDYPAMNPEWRTINLVCSLDGDDVRVARHPLPAMPPELLSLFDWTELSKYLTPAELEALPGARRDADMTGSAEGA